MGVTGLWRLIDASGKPVPLETLEDKVLAIDVSIWIHQVLQGYQDRRGNSVPNAHLLGLYSRICKLLYFKIKPVFVFDGGVPLLKKNTIAARRKQKMIAAGKAEQMKNDLLHNLMKHSLVKDVLQRKTGCNDDVSTLNSQRSDDTVNDMYKLPLLPNNLTDNCDSYESDSSVELSPRKQGKWKGNIHTVDVSNDDFKALPADVRYDILTDLKETRKQNSWGRLHEMPQETHQFSNYQMQRLLKRRKVQESLELAEQEMGGKNLTMEELEKLMIDQGVNIHGTDDAFRIAADSTTRLIYINDLKALKLKSEMSKSDNDVSKPGCSTVTEFNDILPSVVDESSTVLDNINEYDLDDEWDSDLEIIDQPVDSKSVKKFFGTTTINPALSYMLEHSGLSQDQILILIEKSRDNVRNAAKNEKKLKRTHLNFDDKVNAVEKQSKINLESRIGSIQEFIEIKVQPQTSLQENLTNLSSDSESDNFLEVPDVPIPHVNVKNRMEITIKPDDKLNDEEDIFADIFEEETSINNITLNSSHKNNNSTQSSNLNELEEIVINSPTVSELNVITESVKINSSINQVSNSDVNCQSEEELKELPKAIDENKRTVPTTNSDYNSVVLTDNSLQPCHKTTVTPIEKSHDTKQEEPEQLSEDLTISIIERVKSDKTESIISRLNDDKNEILANVDKSGELLTMKSQLENENQELKENIGKLERQAIEVTEQMRSDAQDLLRLFGIPYVVAPQEAEAQCAYLEMVNLTDGTITDDSDIWLFGGRCVYKNFFNNSKRVMEYQSKAIEHHFKLTREQMIQLALLVGSDYTIGINGIGPVTGLEILANFPAEGNDLLRGLMKFSSWIETGRQVGPGKAALRNKLKNITINHGFPSQAVVQAYLYPTVDDSKEPFTWGKPNLILLSDYTREKFGWSKIKFDETMGPVMKRLADKKIQKNIMSYFKVQTVPQSIDENISKRVQKAVKMMDQHAECVDNNSDNVEEQLEAAKQNVKIKSRRITRNKNDDDDDDGDEEKINDIDILNKNVSIIVKANKNKEEYIPQRERNRAAALKKKLQAIEVFKKSRKGRRNSNKMNYRPARKTVKKEAELSESSSDSN